MMKMSISETLITLFGLLHVFSGQVLAVCPTGWEAYGTNCYKFEKDDKLIYDEADAQCWVTGSQLLTIDSDAEHEFISNWLLAHDDNVRPSVWLTRGKFQDGIVKLDDNSRLQFSSNRHWLNWYIPDSHIHTRLAYILVYISQGFVLTVVSPTVPYAYICEMPMTNAFEQKMLERTFEYGRGHVDANTIETGPIFNSQPVNTVFYPNTPEVSIECGVDGNPLPSFSWRRNFVEELSSNTDRYTISGSNFTIQEPVQQNDTGKYQCIAGNEFGSLLSDPAGLIFGYFMPFTMAEHRNVEVTMYEGTRIMCEAPTAYPAARFVWMMGQMMPIYQDRANVFVSNCGYLYFSEVMPTDGGRYYRCIASVSPKYSQDKEAIVQAPTHYSSGVQFVVIQTALKNFKPTIVDTHVFPSPALKGSQVRMECVAYGTLPLTYSWHRKDGRPFQKGTILSDLNRVLTIDNTKLEAEGDYTCAVEGPEGVATKTVSLVIEAKPYFPSGIGNRFVDREHTLLWRCRAVARPAAVYSWYKNGELLANISGEVEVRGDYIEISRVNEGRDSGMYQCGATNVHGTSYSNGQLQVIYFPPNFNRHPLPHRTQMPLGGSFSIPCQPEGAPLPEVVWLKNGGSLGLMPGDTSGRIGMSFENSLVFNTVEDTDAGPYRCKASNMYGDAYSSTTVEVIEAP